MTSRVLTLWPHERSQRLTHISPSLHTRTHTHAHTCTLAHTHAHTAEGIVLTVFPVSSAYVLPTLCGDRQAVAVLLILQIHTLLTEELSERIIFLCLFQLFMA